MTTKKNPPLPISCCYLIWKKAERERNESRVGVDRHEIRIRYERCVLTSTKYRSRSNSLNCRGRKFVEPRPSAVNNAEGTWSCVMLYSHPCVNRRAVLIRTNDSVRAVGNASYDRCKKTASFCAALTCNCFLTYKILNKYMIIGNFCFMYSTKNTENITRRSVRLLRWCFVLHGLVPVVLSTFDSLRRGIQS